ncbi:MAG: TonB-dependent receptor [Ignavibacteria bacterium]|nr:TonB-dependent receptor [Ignavibacteria bacterium]
MVRLDDTRWNKRKPSSTINEESSYFTDRLCWVKAGLNIIFNLNNYLLTAVVLFLLLPTAAPLAETKDSSAKIDRYELSLEQLGRIAVISSKTPKLLSDVSQKVDVLTESQIQHTVTSNRNLSEIIQYLPGASVKVLSRNDANWGAYGGIGGKYNIYLLQGLPVDAFIDPMSLDGNSIYRIEVQRGPASVLYPNYMSQDFSGNQSSLAGTINLVTKEVVTKPATMAAVYYGSYNTITGQIYHENRIGAVSVLGGIDFEKSNYTNYGTSDSWLNMLKDPEYKKSRFYLGSTIPLNNATNSKISLFGNFDIQHGDYGRTNRGFDNYYGLFNIGYSGDLFDSMNVSAKAGIRSYNRQWEEDNYASARDLSLASKNTVKQMIVPTDLSVTYHHDAGKALIVGIDYQYAAYKTTNQPSGKEEVDGNDASAIQLGLYSQEEMRFNNLILRGGLRLNYSKQTIYKFESQTREQLSRDYNHVIWSAGVKYKLSQGWTIFANAGNSFLLPGLKAMGGTIAFKDTTDGQLPNHDLKPESGIGADIGIDIELSPNLTITARGFINSISDAIIDNVVSLTPSQTKSVNVSGKTKAVGYEIGIQQNMSQGFGWFGNITYTKSEINDDYDNDQNGAEIPFVPEMMGNAGITFSTLYDLLIRTSVHFGGTIYDSNSKSGRNSYTSGALLNVLMTKQVALSSETNIEFLVKLYNVTNNKFKMPWQFMDPGFNATFGCRVLF